MHDINENARNIVDNGGCWWMNSLCGLFYRSLDSDARFVIHEIASRLSIRMACYFTHTDNHDIAEDMDSISAMSGEYNKGKWRGMFTRHFNFSLSNSGSPRYASRLPPKTTYYSDSHGLPRH